MRQVKVTVETLEDMLERQMVMTSAMQSALVQHGPTARVEVTRMRSPIGLHVVDWRVLTESDSVSLVKED